MNQRIKDIIREADLVLVGIGEEFEGMKYLKEIPEYCELRQQAEEKGLEWMIPALNRYFIEQKPVLKQVLTNLVNILDGKNYFILTVATNDLVWDLGFKEGRIVAPCGGSKMKQCADGQECECPPTLLSEEEKHLLGQAIESGDLSRFEMKACVCRTPMVFNNIYTEKYDERGYLPQWQIYTKWLQGTLNKKLCILELGVGMQCPGVIRFPFEKIGYFNQKADFIRVNGSLYHLTEELKEKGISISENAVDWLTSMC